MISIRRARALAFALAAALALAACTTIPSSGPVNEGNGAVSSSEPIFPIAEGPRPGDGPAAIVNGFVRASSAGFASDFAVAREYLMPNAAASWDPTAKVTVFDSTVFTTDFDEATSVVTYDIPVQAMLDDSGRLTEAADGTRETLTFTMDKDANGQWRIAELDDGTILAGATFERLFTQVNLIFATVDETVQVPELRWVPQNTAVTSAARELLEGPSEALAPAVHTGFPATAGLEVDSVVVTDGVAAVELTASSGGDPNERSLAQEQMRLTLASIPGVRAVSVTIGGVPLGDDSVKLKPAPLPGAQAAAFVNGRLGLWDGVSVWRVPNRVGGLPEGSVGVTQGFTDQRTAWIVDHSALVTSDAMAGGTESLIKITDDDPAPTAPMVVTELHTGFDLVAPSADLDDWFWTTERAGGDSFVAAKPDGTVATLEVPWLRGTTVQALAVSRDGARLAVLTRTSGEQAIEVASIVRADDGTPLTVGDPLAVGVDLGPAIDLTWIDSLTVAVLGEAGDAPSDLWIVEVGGLTDAQKAVTGALDITAREQERSIVIVDSQGVAYARSGTVWSKLTTGPSELAYSG